MIGISAPSYDPSGSINFPVARPRNPYESARRGNVTATLDGGVAVYDTGYALSDQTLSVHIVKPKLIQLQTLRYLVAYYGQVIAATEVGCFSAVPAFAVSGDTLAIKLRLVTKLSA